MVKIILKHCLSLFTLTVAILFDVNSKFNLSRKKRMNSKTIFTYIKTEFICEVKINLKNIIKCSNN